MVENKKESKKEVTTEVKASPPMKLSPKGLASRQAAHDRKVIEFTGGE